MQASFLFDATSLFNFAAVDRIGLLVVPFAGRAFIARAVESEILAGLPTKRDVRLYRDQTWLTVEDPRGAEELRYFAIYRQTVFGERRNQGEAQSLAIARVRCWRFVSDDVTAINVSERDGVQVMTTTDVLASLVAAQRLSSDTARKIAREMQHAGRPVDPADLAGI